MNSLDELQQQVGAWGQKTFPHSTPTSIITHLRREAEELAWATHQGEIAEECADCLLLLLHLAHRGGFSLQARAEVKFAECLKRDWLAPDESGVSEHKRSQGTFAIPGQQPRPALEAAIVAMEERMKADRCEVCGKQKPMLRFELQARWDGQQISPLMCLECWEKP